MRLNIKRGMASLYLVAFTTLLLGVVTISFVEIMVNESKESSNSDLSQSAFDAALAGIEDAKNAIILYNSCLNLGDNNVVPSGSTKTCKDIITAMNDGRKNRNCDVVANVLGDTAAAATNIAEDSLDQAYTCVTIANDSSDYRSVLNDNDRSRVIPINSTDSEGLADSKIVSVELQWYSATTDPDFDQSKYMSDLYTDLYGSNIIPFGNKNDVQGTGSSTTAPIVNFEFFQTDKDGFTMTSLDLNNDNNTGTDHAMIMLYPDGNASKTGEIGTVVSAKDLLNASSKSSNAALTSSKDKNQSVVPKLVNCSYTTGYRCRVRIDLPATYGTGSDDNVNYQKNTRSDSTFVLRTSLPYGGPQTDFKIKLCTAVKPDGSCEYADFDGAQYIVDSTGRASTLYRRVTARIETTPGFMFPEYAVQVSGLENSTIEKRFYVTDNCWSTDGKGNSTNCANNGDASTEFPKGK